jgi:hypothetical protein
VDLWCHFLFAIADLVAFVLGYTFELRIFAYDPTPDCAEALLIGRAFKHAFELNMAESDMAKLSGVFERVLPLYLHARQAVSLPGAIDGKPVVSVQATTMIWAPSAGPPFENQRRNPPALKGISRAKSLV